MTIFRDKTPGRTRGRKLQRLDTGDLELRFAVLMGVLLLVYLVIAIPVIIFMPL